MLHQFRLLFRYFPLSFKSQGRDNKEKNLSETFGMLKVIDF